MNKLNKCLLVALALVSSVTAASTDVHQTGTDGDAGHPITVKQPVFDVVAHNRSSTFKIRRERAKEQLGIWHSQKREYESRIEGLQKDLINVATNELAGDPHSVRMAAYLKENIENLVGLGKGVDAKIDAYLNRLLSASQCTKSSDQPKTE